MNRERYDLIREAVFIELVINHVGMENAVHSKVFERRYDISGRTLRDMISSLRRIEGYPICSCRNGYFYPRTRAELEDTVKRMHTMSKSYANVGNSLLYRSLPIAMNTHNGGYYDDTDELPFI